VRSHANRRAIARRPKLFLSLGAALFLALVLGVSLASAVPPVVTVEDASGVSYTTANVKGTVNPEGQSTTWRFQYATQPDFSDAVTGPEGSTETEKTLERQLTGLKPNTTYHLRLLAENGDGPSEAKATNTFTTLAVATPSISIDPPTAVSEEKASFSGTVNPNAPGPAPQDPAFDTQWRFVCSPECLGLGSGTIAADNAAHPVADDAVGLEPNTEYTITLQGRNAGGTGEDQATFTTDAVPPEVGSNATGATNTTAYLAGWVNPHNSPTKYHFEYGTAGPCSANPCASTLPTSAAEGNEPAFASVLVKGLETRVTYHYRLVATSDDGGTTVGPDRTVLTDISLPDDRAYEKVSPADKSGSPVSPNSSRTRASLSGDAVQYSALTAFGDAQGGGQIGSDYMAQRGPNGWSTHGLTLPQPATRFPVRNSLYVGEFSDDLSRGVFLAQRPVGSGHPNVEAVPNLYLRTDPLGAPPGNFELLSDSVIPQSGPLDIFESTNITIADATPDLGQIIFESERNLTQDAVDAGLDTSVSKLYEWDHGTLRLAGILPDDACGSPPCPAPGSQAGRGALANEGVGDFYTQGTISDDGSRVFFTDRTGAGGSPERGQLYMRLDHTSTVHLNASERATPDPGGPKPAILWATTPDGSKAYFSTSEQLTDEDNNTASDIYSYDADLPESDPHNLTLISVDSEPRDESSQDYPPGRQVIGVSDDGSTVYFEGRSQLVPGAPLGIRKRAGGSIWHIFAWRDGDIRWVGAWGENNDASLGSDPYGNENAEGDKFKQARVSPDGDTLIYLTSAPERMTGYDPQPPAQFDCGNQESGCEQVYTYTYEDDELTCASCNQVGKATLQGNAQVMSKTESIPTSTTSTSHLNRPMTANGGQIFFSSPEPLVRNDVNGKYDVYDYDTHTGQVRLITTGQSSSDSLFMEATPDGSDVFFATREKLVASDTDNLYDLYDARVGGGFAGDPPSPPPCEGDACQPSPVAPNDATPASAGFSGPGNPTAATRRGRANCKRGAKRVKRKGHVRCVKHKRAKKTSDRRDK
jgi:hypothetical protein